MEDLKIKVCGMTHSDNIRETSALGIDYIGLIFYNKSSRFVKEINIPPIPGVKKVGVFVNESLGAIDRCIRKYKLDCIQLHGEESPAECSLVRKNGVEVFKAVSIGPDFNFDILEQYSECVDCFIFDAKGPRRGGNGIPFDWRKLVEYEGSVPFFLSGGVGPDMVSEIKSIKHPRLYGLDINSRFEVKPGVKNIDHIRQFLLELKV